MKLQIVFTGRYEAYLKGPFLFFFLVWKVPADLRFTGSGDGLTCPVTFDAIHLLDTSPAKMAVIYLDQLAL